MNYENEMTAIVPGKRVAWIALAVALAVTTAGCSGQKPTPANAAVVKGAAAALAGPMCGGTDVHTKHIDLQVGCATCHPCGGEFGFAVPFTYPGGTTTAGGTFVRAIDVYPTTCTVACHSPLGGPLKPVEWTAGPQACATCHVSSTLPAQHPVITNPRPVDADCTRCHTTGSHTSGTVTLIGHAPSWMDTASPGFHAIEANKGLASCQGCHGTALTGLAAAVSCGQCHDAALPVGVASWKVNCIMCHGGNGNQTGAPPKTTWGNSADTVRVGAHATHLAGTATSPAVACTDCHVRPADVLSAGHIDGLPTANVTWSGLAVARGAAPTWTRTSATCSGTYCHGNFANGTDASVVWTQVGLGAAACGTCHGNPPGGTHPVVSAALNTCASCHPETMNASGALIPIASGGKHLDGAIQATTTASAHVTGWMDAASPDFHAFDANAGISSCQGCHGVNLDGVGGTATTSCATCHGATWKTTCTLCHGGTSNATGAPPKGTWGFRTDVARIGAHTKHVVAGTIAPAFACSACHVNPANALSAGHLDGSRATVAWSGVAVAGGAKPTWNGTVLTCASTYCHGGYSGTYQGFDPFTGGTILQPYAGKNGTPAWTGPAMTCTSCHEIAKGLLAGPWHSGSHGGSSAANRNSCNVCHPGVDALGTSFTSTAKHLNGVIDRVDPTLNSACTSCHY